MRRLIVLTLALLPACNEAPSIGGSDTGLAVARSSRAKDSLIRVKDSLLAIRAEQLTMQSQLIGDAATSARLVAEIDKALSDARIRIEPETGRNESAMRNVSTDLAVVQKKVDVVLRRLRASEARVRRMRQDSTNHAALDAQQLAEYQQSLDALRTTVENQQREIVVLTQRVDSLTQVNVVLAARNDSVEAVNAELEAQDDRVYVAIGTERELAAKGVVRREGGTLLLFGRGKTIVPGRNPDPDAFQVLSKSRDRTIALPHPARDYRVVSRQSLAYTDVARPQDAIVRDTLRITDPQNFWAASRYLILVQK
ncbi:MAG TPA: hypothetical protein VF178_16025 [Gemmatimonadaceae bacterium]